MSHVILLGDSIFDNASYVGGGPDVVAQLAAILPAGQRASLLAVDGAVASDVGRQLTRVPRDASALVLSVGGNDALRHVDLLARRARSGAEVLGWFAEAAGAFADRYRSLLRQLAAVAEDRRVVVCTIYNGNLDPEMQRAASAALAIFNDAISRAAREHGFPVIELRSVCTEPSDYANPIEPSVQGGAKIARAIAAAVLSGDA